MKNITLSLVVHVSTNLLTVIVGQQQLVEIQRSLKNIEEKLKSIIQDRDNEFFVNIESQFAYFKKIIERFIINGINLGARKIRNIEDFYTAKLQNLKVLNKRLKDIDDSIDQLKEHETIRKWGEAAVIKYYQQLIEAFNCKQELVLLNIKFIEECYEPYLIIIRSYQEGASKSCKLDEIVADN